MIGGRSALLSAAGGGNPYGNWTGNYDDVSLLLRGYGGGLGVVDESPTPKTISISGSAGASISVYKYGDGSLKFDGSNSVISTPSSTEFDLGGIEFTIEMWIRFNTLSGTQVIISQGNWNFSSSNGGGVSTGYRIQMVNGALWWYINSTAAITSSVSPVAGQWHHISVCRSGSTTRMFVDGTLAGTTTANFSNPAPTTPLFVGAFTMPGSYFPFNGYIDDLRITKNFARYVEGTGANAGKMVFAGTNDLALPTAELPANINDDSNYNYVSLLLREGTPNPLIPIDESPVPKDIGVVGSPGINTTLFKYGDSALDFPGASGNHYSIFGLNDFTPGLGAWTVEAWIYPKSTANWVIMSGSNFYLTRVSTSTYVGDGSVNRIAVASVPAVNQWTHVAAVRESSGTIRLFFNGIQQASSTESLSTATTTGILIGGRTAGATVGTDALLDDVRVTVGVARYTKNFLPPPAELPAI